LARHGFLFADNKGPWSTERLTKVLTRETSKRLGFRMTIQEYRHIAIAIDREFIRGSSAEADEDEEGEGEDDIHDLMAAHSSKLANARYARMGGLSKGLTPESINLYRSVSDKWQRWYKLESRREISIKIKAVRTEPETHESAVRERMMKALQTMYGTNAKFKSVEQQAAVINTAMGTNQLFVILPTGKGKSLTFMLPAMQSHAETTVVITPLVALAEDLLRRCKATGIDAIIYGRGVNRSARIVVIVTETVISGSCLQFIRDLYLTKCLDRIVFDECHKLLHDQGFRPKLAAIKDLCVEVQLVYLTATFPPTMLNAYKDAMCLNEPRFIRLVGHKLRTRYNVLVLDGEQFDQLADEQIQNMLSSCEEMDKVLVFCRSKKMSETWAKRWDCEWFNSDTKNKAEVLESWTSGLMFATGSLGAGVDIMSIRAVIHVGEPYGMINFDQEVGRGGRGGEMVESLTLLSDDEEMKLRQRKVHTLSQDEKAMHEFLTTNKCRRTGMSVYLNGENHDVTCESLESELCGNCKVHLSHTMAGKRRATDDEELERRVRQRQSYERRWSDLQTTIMREEQRVQDILRIVNHLQDTCPACWLIGEIGEHEGKKCKYVERALGMRYEVFQGNYLEYEKYSCCYRCSLPQELCGQVGKSCSRVDVILPIILVGFERQEELELVKVFEEVMDGRVFENIAEYIRWIGMGERWLGHKGTNGFKMFESIIRKRLM
jgi:superfamily II DNA helicase RecQ